MAAIVLGTTVLGWLISIVQSHTTEICIAVSEDQTVLIGASTYHTDTVVVGGALLTINGVTTRYNFTGWESDDNGRPPDCQQDGIECDCSYCACSYGNDNDHWQTVSISGLDPGTYAVTTTTDSAVEEPCCTFTDTVTVYFPPTPAPTLSPTDDPTAPTDAPTGSPSQPPSSAPTQPPTSSPSAAPSGSPTMTPSAAPSLSPTDAPSLSPTKGPSLSTLDPTSDPTTEPTSEPTVEPTSDPTMEPTSEPTLEPTMEPTVSPSAAPTPTATDGPVFEKEEAFGFTLFGNEVVLDWRILIILVVAMLCVMACICAGCSYFRKQRRQSKGTPNRPLRPEGTANANSATMTHAVDAATETKSRNFLTEMVETKMKDEAKLCVILRRE